MAPGGVESAYSADTGNKKRKEEIMKIVFIILAIATLTGCMSVDYGAMPAPEPGLSCAVEGSHCSKGKG